MKFHFFIFWVGVLTCANYIYSAGFQPIEDPVSGGDLTVLSISGNGDFVAGRVTIDGIQRAARWKSDGSLVLVPALNGFSGNQSPRGLSFDGSIMIGDQQNSLGNFGSFRWVDSGGVGITSSLTSPLGTYNSIAATGLVSNGVSSVGGVFDGIQDPRAVTISSAGSASFLAQPANTTFSNALGVSSNGAYATGEAFINTSTSAIRWNLGTGQVSTLPSLFGGDLSQGFAVSDSGIIAGTSGSRNSGRFPVFWDGSTVTRIGSGVGSANDITPDGRFIVGRELVGNVNHAFLYDRQTNQRRFISEILTELGVDVGSLVFRSGEAISDDGLRIVADGYYIDLRPSPEFDIDVFQAIGVTFNTQSGETYFIEASDNNVDFDKVREGILGTGSRITEYFPRVDRREFYRTGLE